MELLPEGQTNKTEVSWEDQQRINEFSKLINRKDQFEVELAELSHEKDYLDDLSLEIELLDDDGKVNYKLGDTFVLLRHSSVVTRLENDNLVLAKKMTALENSIEVTQERMNELKNQLYAKFGQSINLDR
ncbi:hypothetical protein LJB42_000050 [Komagataella kurtzmanii]|nr:hypothetical protein LJB42_000050 [Komagataella kurtzmanii]